MQYFRVKNYEKFQHFKDRTPPWIKLYRDILDDPDWHELDGDTAKTLIGLWLIASEDETHQGALPSVRKMAFRLRTTEDKLQKALSKLSHWLVRDDITLISDRYQDDAPETEREGETEREENKAYVGKADDRSAEVKEIIAAWNAMACSCGIATVRVMTGKRKRQAISRLSKPLWARSWQEALSKIPESDFLCGRVGSRDGRSWSATIDWFLRPDSVTKIIEGQYRNGRPVKAASTPRDPAEAQRERDMFRQQQLEAEIEQERKARKASNRPVGELQQIQDLLTAQGAGGPM
jgi:hypothetical protein